MVEFTLQLLRALCRNFRACIGHWKNIAEHGGCNKRSEAMGFLNKWLDEDRLNLLCSFVDVCEIFAKVAWKFQRNQITIMDVPE